MKEEYEQGFLTADILIFSQPDDCAVPEILLIKRGIEPFIGRYALPGGHLDKGERLIGCARRELKEETGIDVDKADLKKVGIYDEPERDPRGRYITVAFYAIVDKDSIQAVAGDDAKEARWFNVKELPQLAFDHDKIISDALSLIGKAR